MLPFFDYRPALAAHRDEYDRAIARVLDSGRLILGEEVRAFEEEFAGWIGVPHAVGVNSGTDALALALRALGIGAGDEVITVANAASPPVAAIRMAGATPRLVDVDPETLTLDPSAVERAVGPRTRCLLPVHLYGLPADLDPLLALAERHGLALVEDVAQAHGSSHRGRALGSVGTVGCFSFYPTKNLGGFGDGGMCVTADEALARRIRAMRMYGYDAGRHSRIEGINSRLDELQAALLRVRLRHLAEELAERRMLAERYRRRLAGLPLRLPPRPEGGEPPWHLFVVRSERRADDLRRLDRDGIGYGIHYPVAVHRMDAYRGLELPAEGLPVTERACEQVVSLPLYPGLTSAEIDRVADSLAAGR